MDGTEDDSLWTDETEVDDDDELDFPSMYNSYTSDFITRLYFSRTGVRGVAYFPQISGLNFR